MYKDIVISLLGALLLEPVLGLTEVGEQINTSSPGLRKASPIALMPAPLPAYVIISSKGLCTYSEITFLALMVGIIG